MTVSKPRHPEKEPTRIDRNETNETMRIATRKRHLGVGPTAKSERIISRKVVSSEITLHAFKQECLCNDRLLRSLGGDCLGI